MYGLDSCDILLDYVRSEGMAEAAAERLADQLGHAAAGTGLTASLRRWMDEQPRQELELDPSVASFSDVAALISRSCRVWPPAARLARV